MFVSSTVPDLLAQRLPDPDGQLKLRVIAHLIRQEKQSVLQPKAVMTQREL